MKNSWDSDSRLTGQEIPLLFWNPKIHNRIHKSRHTAKSWASQIQFTHSQRIYSILLLYYACLQISQVILSLQVSTRLLQVSLLINRDLIILANNGRWRTQIQNPPVVIFLYSLVTFSPLDPYILLSTLYIINSFNQSTQNSKDGNRKQTHGIRFQSYPY